MNSAKTLLELQAIDQRMAAQRSAYRRITIQLEAAGDLKQLRAECESARVRVLERRLEHSKLEAEVAALRERIEKIESRLYSGAITNMRELTALEEEHTITKRSLARSDESVVPSRIASEDARARHEELVQSLAESEQAWATTKSELWKEAETVSKDCQELETERLGAAEGIDESDLALYVSLLPRKSGVAVARVERGICQGCRIKLPMREMSKLKNSDKLVVCANCGRILLAS